ncbi:unnamed protein product [Adineta steineri]|uniref:Uncharacterized protein n=1 Tax=Adineta steineri TaxID=433720 RepID=A0A815MHC5_9BILA|nr:unnamed protein product [Adineta steineri]CAF1619948.1 unnamed protein product [Adineta steineri]
MPHIPYFINNKTTEPTLQQLIQATTATMEFTIDTESYNIYKQNKQIFMWGSKHELDPFTTFELFKQEQFDNINIINLQLKFKQHWTQQHPHQKKSDEIINDGCLCERCLGKEASHTWFLQDGILYSFEEYLPKELTCVKFNIGLDHNLFTMNSDELSYREKLTKYAINDCIAMQRIIMNMKQNNFNFKIKNLFNYELENISFDDENDSPQPPPAHVPIVDLIRYPHDWESILINEQVPEHIHDEQVHENIHDEHIHEHIQDEQPQSPPPPTHTELTLEEQARKRTQNRKRTIKQRSEKTLRQHGIPYSAVNKSKSGSTLYIGLKQADNIDEHERIAQHLFSTQHHQQYRHQQHYRQHHQNHHQQHPQNHHQQHQHHRH